MPNVILEPESLIGRDFDRLTVEAYGGYVRRDENNQFHVWRCICSCGNRKTVPHHKLISGHTRSCGCLRKDSMRKVSQTHGRSKTRLYHIWAGMVARCYNPNFPQYSDYGGRGIVMCPEWKSSFESFSLDMGEPPTNDHTIERIDNSLGYYKNNCCWATRTEQARNRRSSVFVTWSGERLTLAEWAERVGIPYKTLHYRYKKGWSIDRLLTEPLNNSWRQ